MTDQKNAHADAVVAASIGNGNKGGGSKNLSAAHGSDPEKEKLAAQVVETFTGCCTKLKELKKDIEQIRQWFKDLKGSQTLAGCRSFKEFCEKRLNRTEQAVYAMLGDYGKKKTTSDGSSKKKATNPPLKPQTISPEDQDRLVTAANAARRYFEAEEQGDAAKAEDAKKEFEAISTLDPIKSTIFGDQPNYKYLLIDLLADMEALGSRLPVTLTCKCAAIRKRMGIADPGFRLDIPNPYAAPGEQKRRIGTAAGERLLRTGSAIA
jgi:hypothetical protein